MASLKHSLYVGLESSSCIGVSPFSLSMLRMLSKASHNKPSSSQSGGVVGACSTPVGRRQLTTARIIPPGGVDEYGGKSAPVKYGWEDVAFQTSRDLGEIREVKLLGILE